MTPYFFSQPTILHCVHKIECCFYMLFFLLPDFKTQTALKMDKRKQSMKVPDAALLRKQSILPRKQSVEGKKAAMQLEVPGYVGRRPSIDSRGRRPSMDMRRMSFSDMATRRQSLAGSLMGRGENSSAKDRQNIKYENTYRLEPEQAFPVGKVKEIAQDILESHLKGLPYDKDECTKLSKTLTDTIKQHVKALGNPRYKIVVVVAIGQVMDSVPSVCFTSRCIWNDKMDNFIETSYKNKKLYAVALVYGVYVD